MIIMIKNDNDDNTNDNDENDDNNHKDNHQMAQFGSRTVSPASRSHFQIFYSDIYLDF